jgi:hypothetical protein
VLRRLRRKYADYNVSLKGSRVACASAILSEAGDPSVIAKRRAEFRNVFEMFAVHPSPKRHPYRVTPYARLSAIMGAELFPKARTTEEMLSEQGLAYDVFDNGELSQILPYRRAK